MGFYLKNYIFDLPIKDVENIILDARKNTNKGENLEALANYLRAEEKIRSNPFIYYFYDQRNNVESSLLEIMKTKDDSIKTEIYEKDKFLCGEQCHFDSVISSPGIKSSVYFVAKQIEKNGDKNYMRWWQYNLENNSIVVDNYMYDNYEKINNSSKNNIPRIDFNSYSFSLDSQELAYGYKNKICITDFKNHYCSPNELEITPKIIIILKSKDRYNIAAVTSFKDNLPVRKADESKNDLVYIWKFKKILNETKKLKFKVKTQYRIETSYKNIMNLNFNKTGETLLVSGSKKDNKTNACMLVNLKFDDKKCTKNLGYNIWSGKIASADANRSKVASNDNINFHVSVADLNSNLNTCTGHTKPITSIQFSSTNDFLASSSEDETARIWKTENGNKGIKCTPFYKIKQGPKVENVIFSPDGAYVATNGRDNIVRLWELDKLKKYDGDQHDNIEPEPIAEFKGHQDSITSLVFAPNDQNSFSKNKSNQRLVTSSRDGTIRLWDWSSKKLSENPSIDELIDKGCTWVGAYLSHPTQSLDKITDPPCKSHVSQKKDKSFDLFWSQAIDFFWSQTIMKLRNRYSPHDRPRSPL